MAISPRAMPSIILTLRCKIGARPCCTLESSFAAFRLWEVIIAVRIHSSPIEAFRRLQLQSRAFLVPVFRRCQRDQRLQQIARCFADLRDCQRKCGLVDFRWRIEATELAHELQRGGVDFVVRHGRREVEQGFDIAAHGNLRRRVSREQMIAARALAWRVEV